MASTSESRRAAANAGITLPDSHEPVARLALSVVVELRHWERAGELVVEYSIEGGSLTPEQLVEILGEAVPVPVAHAVVRLELTQAVQALVRELVTASSLSCARAEHCEVKQTGSDPTDIIRDMADYFVVQNWILIRHVAELLHQFEQFDCPIPNTLVRDARQVTHLAVSYGLAAMLVTCESHGRRTRGGGLILADSLVPKMVCFADSKASSTFESAIERRMTIMAGPSVRAALQAVVQALVEFRWQLELGAAVERDIVRCVREAERIVDLFAGALPHEVTRELEGMAYAETVRLLAADYASGRVIEVPSVDPELRYDALKGLALALRDERETLCALGAAMAVGRLAVQSNWVAICRVADIVRVTGKISGEKVRELLNSGTGSDGDLAA